MLHVVVFGLIATVQGVPAPGHGTLEGYCITDEHCELTECCVQLPRGFSPHDVDDKIFVTGKCFPNSSPHCPRPCRRTGHCLAGECCVIRSFNPYIRGRRGVCRPMGEQDAKCHQINGSGRPGDGEVVQGSCPCHEPYTCGNIISKITDPTLTATCGYWRG